VAVAAATVGGVNQPVIVGISLRPQEREGLAPRQVQNRSYLEAIEAAGAIPLPIPLLHDTERLGVLYRLCDALVLPGGPDVEPARYGAPPRQDCAVEPAPELDAVELQLLRWALDDDLPVLAICRGLQVLNALGGTLWQDLVTEGAVSDRHDRDEDRAALVHGLSVEPGSRLAAIVGTGAIEVNSLHHQAIRDLAPGLVVTARSSDGLIEGAELPGRRFVVGVQCHPEELTGGQPWAASLFSALVDAAVAPAEVS